MSSDGLKQAGAAEVRAEGPDPLRLALSVVKTSRPAVQPRDEGAEQRFEAFLAASGVSRESAESLGWEWCADSGDLPGAKGAIKARGYAGITGPRCSDSAHRPDWFFCADPPVEGSRTAETPAPKNVLAALPARGPDGFAGPLHLAGDPIAAARLYQEGKRAAWIRGGHGWRGSHRRMLPQLLALDPGAEVILVPGTSCWEDPDEFKGWAGLAEHLRATGRVVRAVGPDGAVENAAATFAAGNRPESERDRAAREIRESLAVQGPVLVREFREPLARAQDLVGRGARFVGRYGLEVVALSGAVVSCFERVAKGPSGLWAYDRGVWRPAGDFLPSLLSVLLAEDWSRHYEAEAIAHVARRSDLPTLSAHPITDGWADVLNFGNGLLDWRNGRLRAHDPGCLSTWRLPVSYDPEARCPQFRDFLAQVLPPDMLAPAADGVAPWQEDLGYMLLPGNPLHSAFLLRGQGRNGKGVYMTVVTAMVGRDFVSTLSLEDMVDPSRSRFRLASLVGSAVNLCGEVDPKYLSSTAQFKTLTGGDPVSVEEKFKKDFSYLPWTTPVFSANNDFAAIDRSIAYFERWQVRSFPNVIPRPERDPDLAARLIRDELAGITAAAVAGLRSLMARGTFPATASSEAVASRFRRYSDHLMRFIEERVEYGPGFTTNRPDFYQAYKAWCEEEGLQRPVTSLILLEEIRKLAAPQGIDLEERKKRGIFEIRGARLIRSGP